MKKYSYNLLEIKSNFSYYKENIKKEEILNLMKEGYSQISLFFSD